MTLALVVSRVQRFASVEDAALVARRFLAAIQARSLVIPLSVSSIDETLALDAADLSAVIAAGEIAPDSSPAGYTHAVGVRTIPDAPDAGTLLLRAGDEAPPGPGLSFAMRLHEGRFPLVADELVALLVACLAATGAEEAIIAPASWIGAKVGWAWWTRTGAGRGVAAARFPCGDGEIVIAHGGTPEDESSEAFERAKRVRDELGFRHEAAVEAQPAPTDAEAARDQTVELRGDQIAALRLPFAKPAPGTTVAAGVSAPREARARRSFETEDIDTAKLRRSLPAFLRGVGVALPELTVEQYAQLRIALAANGEDDRATWLRFGIAGPDQKQELQARFAARFRDDPAEQARFVAMVEHLRRTSVSSTLEADELDGTMEVRGGALRPALPFGSGNSPPSPTVELDPPVGAPPRGR